MKKKRLFLASCMTVACATVAVCATACGGTEDTPPAPTYYKVTFDMMGHGDQIESLPEVEKNSTISKPTDPTADGWIFGGWYQDNACTIPWNFDSSKVIRNTTLYASWAELLYNFTFDVQGHGTAPETQKIKPDAKAQEPQAPTADGWVFNGWYKESACTTIWNFSTDTVTEDTTVYASWEQIPTFSSDEPFTLGVTETSYFIIPAAGQYTLYLTAENLDEHCLIDGKESIIQHNEKDVTSPYFVTAYFTVGTHTVACEENPFNAEIKFDCYDVPFTDVMQYVGNTYALNVSGLGENDEGKYSVCSFSFGDKENVYAATCTAIEGDIYTLEYVTYDPDDITHTPIEHSVRIKLGVADGKVKYVYVLEEDSDEEADRLSKEMTAEDAAIPLVAGEHNDRAENDFKWVVYDFSEWKNQYVVINNPNGNIFAFLGYNKGYNRFGEITNRINFTEGKSFLLQPGTYDKYLAVYLLDGETSVSFTWSAGSEPEGLREGNPVYITADSETGDADYLFEDVAAGQTYYFRFNTSQPGLYNVTIKETNTNETIYYVNGTKVGYDFMSNTWFGGISYNNRAAKFELGSSTLIPVTTAGSRSISLTFRKIPDPVYGTLESGTYEVTSGSNTLSIIIDADGETPFISYAVTPTKTGYYSVVADKYELILTETMVTKTYSCEISPERYIKFSVNEDGSLNITQTPQQSGELTSAITATKTSDSKEYPAVTLNAGTYTWNEDANTKWYVIVSADKTKVEFACEASFMPFDEKDIALTHDGNHYSFEFEGDTYSFYAINEDTIVVTMPISGGYEFFSQMNIEGPMTGTYVFLDATEKYTIVLAGDATEGYTVTYGGAGKEAKTYALNVIPGGYGFTYELGDDSNVSIKLAFSSYNKTISITNYNFTSDGYVATFTYKEPVPETADLAAGQYDGKLSYTENGETVETRISFVVNSDLETGKITETKSGNTTEVAIAKVGTVYNATYDGYTIEFYIDEEGNAVVTESYWYGTGTLKKDAGAVGQTIAEGEYKLQTTYILHIIEVMGNDEDGYTVNYKYNDFSNENLPLTANADGTFSFNASLMNNMIKFKVTFTVVSTTQLDATSSNGDGPKGSFTREVPSTQSIAEGTYTSDDGVRSITITGDDIDGYTAVLGMFSQTPSGAVTKKDDTTYTFTATFTTFGTMTVEFIVKSDTEIEVTGGTIPTGVYTRVDR